MKEQPFTCTLSAAAKYQLGDPILVTFEISRPVFERSAPDIRTMVRRQRGRQLSSKRSDESHDDCVQPQSCLCARCYNASC